MIAPFDRRVGLVHFIGLCLGVRAVGAQEAGGEAARLPDLGPAADFALTRETGEPFAFGQTAGKIVVVTFLFTSCPDVCPLLTQKLVAVQDALGPSFGRDVYFVSITVDPEVDGVDVLAGFATAMGCNGAGWAFLTGGEAEIRAVARAYGVVFRKAADGSVLHNLLTSVVDRAGRLRVQYLGSAFAVDTLLADLRQLQTEADPS